MLKISMGNDSYLKSDIYVYSFANKEFFFIFFFIKIES